MITKIVVLVKFPVISLKVAKFRQLIARNGIGKQSPKITKRSNERCQEKPKFRVKSRQIKREIERYDCMALQ